MGAAPSAAAVAPPAVNSQRQFNVIANTSAPFTFTQVTATAKYVGRKVAIYLDDAAPASGYSQSDLDATGNLFDTQMYAVDSAAFGTESDIDGNGVVAVLLSPAINESERRLQQHGQRHSGLLLRARSSAYPAEFQWR